MQSSLVECKDTHLNILSFFTGLRKKVMWWKICLYFNHHCDIVETNLSQLWEKKIYILVNIIQYSVDEQKPNSTIFSCSDLVYNLTLNKSPVFKTFLPSGRSAEAGAYFQKRLDSHSQKDTRELLSTAAVCSSALISDGELFLITPLAETHPAVGRSSADCRHCRHLRKVFPPTFNFGPSCATPYWVADARQTQVLVHTHTHTQSYSFDEQTGVILMRFNVRNVLSQLPACGRGRWGGGGWSYLAGNGQNGEAAFLYSSLHSLSALCLALSTNFSETYVSL